METKSATLIVDCMNALGEGVQWNPADKKIYWTDIFGNTLWSCDEDGTSVSLLKLPAGLCAFAFTQDRMLAAFTDGLYWFDLAHKTRELIQLYQPDLPHTRMNDGGLDRQGRFVIGGIDEDGMRPITPIWNVEPNGISEIIQGVGCANSLVFSPDGQILYFADTADTPIYAMDYDQTDGTASNKRLFADSNLGKPDGSCVDAEGGLWNARFGGASVQRFSADGAEDFRVTLPVPNVTCCCIGGSNMNRLFITTARLGMSDDSLASSPKAGGLFMCDLPYTGLPHGTFKT